MDIEIPSYAEIESIICDYYPEIQNPSDDQTVVISYEVTSVERKSASSFLANFKTYEYYGPYRYYELSQFLEFHTPLEERCITGFNADLVFRYKDNEWFIESGMGLGGYTEYNIHDISEDSDVPVYAKEGLYFDILGKISDGIGDFFSCCEKEDFLAFKKMLNTLIETDKDISSMVADWLKKNNKVIEECEAEAEFED